MGQFNVMATSLCFSLLLLSVATTYAGRAGKIGINYGRVADNLPNPERVVQLLKSQGITDVKIFDTDPTVLNAFSNTGINLVVTLPNELLSSSASNQSYTDTWIRSNILPFYPKTQITAICVGNEVLDDTNDTQFLVPAMTNVINSLTKNNLDSSIKVSSPISLNALKTSYPPSSGSFNPNLTESVIKPMCQLLRKTNSSLMVNAYPFFAYSDASNKIPLEYALFGKNSGMSDSGNGLRYTCLFDAQVDAVRAAMKAISYDDVRIVVTETGWPSKGDGPNEAGASESNAAAYNGNLVKKILSGSGTPLKPDESLDVYLFALFNENQKPGPTSERNYGLFYPDERKVYDVPLTVELPAEGR